MRKNILSATLVGVALLTSGCASNNRAFVIAPQLSSPAAPVIVNKLATLQVTDLRTSTHIVQIFQEDKAAKLISSQTELLNVLQASLAKSLTNNGIQMTPLAENSIEVAIKQAKINVHQSLMKYKVDNIIELLVTAKSHDKTLTKTFRTKGNNNGPLFADLAVLERDFNQQLSKLIMQVASDIELQQLIK